MRLLLIEFITAGGCAGEALPASLAEEGDFMLSAVLRDAQLIPELSVIVPRDQRLQAPPFACEVVTVHDHAWAEWRELARQVDCVLAIAPETDRALERLNAMVEEGNRVLLGCSSKAVRLTASKMRTYEHLRAAGIACVPTFSANAELRPSDRGWVVKPDDGAGSEHTWHASSEVQARQLAKEVPNAVVQPSLDGEALSLSVLCGQSEIALLACNRQIVSIKGSQLRQTGVEVNGAVEYFESMQSLAGRVVGAIPGLFGFVGIDLIMTAKGAVILEINPRLTTAYAGISASIGVNALDMMMRHCLDDKVPREIGPLARKPIMVLPHAQQ